MARQGPSAAKMVAITGSSQLSISKDGLTIKNNGDYQTAKCNVKVKSGKWFYEIKLLTNSTQQLGWVTDEFSSGKVGADKYSWAYDGSRQKKHHAGSATWYGQYWYTGDTIGFGIDLDSGTMNFYRNGKDLGVAYTSCDFGNGVFPAITLSRNQNVTVNFGKDPWKFPPPADYSGLHCFLTEKQLRDLGALFTKFKNIGISTSESGNTGEAIKGQGFLEYGKALGVVDDEDLGLFLLAWRLDAVEEQLELQQDEFIDGWTSHGAADIPAMKEKLNEWREEIKDPSEFKKFYFFMFDYLKEERKTYLPTEEALMVWGLLGLDKTWKFYPKFKEYLEKEKTQAISRDTWRQFLDFTKTHAESMDDYDEMSSWPVLMDGFYYFATGKEQDDDGW
eukprot:TRINITY_DN1592_c0_g1_i1.p1 TRINITY_DN1592_c0_g1~~TRINITY_DN1592_c0_g1_i1.p1  ORF type:complete len:391 (+),score=83.05 TRINITY_DN1592_c0_g1_i1:41-1213(+)